MIKPFGDGRDWFSRKRFGMFIHWGLYAIPAWHEQILWRGDIRRRDYEKLVGEFNPRQFDPDAWLDVLQEAGMEYLCITTKHHDGFCLWDTAYTDYNVMRTPYGKDIIGMLAEACHRRGVVLGFYYSLPDWHHRNYPNLGRHHEMLGPRPGDDPDDGKYLEFVGNQVRELLTNYGPLGEFFWDINVAKFHAPELNQMIRDLQPDALINDRGPAAGDYSTPERHVPEGTAFTSPTEAVQSLGRESWGYREGEDYYAHKFLMQSVDRILAMGGNYLLNVGPKADGTFPDECDGGAAPHRRLVRTGAGSVRRRRAVLVPGTARGGGGVGRHPVPLRRAAADAARQHHLRALPARPADRRRRAERIRRGAARGHPAQRWP